MEHPSLRFSPQKPKNPLFQKTWKMLKIVINTASTSVPFISNWLRFNKDDYCEAKLNIHVAYISHLLNNKQIVSPRWLNTHWKYDFRCSNFTQIFTACPGRMADSYFDKKSFFYNFRFFRIYLVFNHLKVSSFWVLLPWLAFATSYILEWDVVWYSWGTMWLK